MTELATEPHSPSSFDAVIVGAGHNGLTLAAYLARSGLSVGVFERRGEEGGGLCTEELTLPGFLHNVHANYHTFVGLAPAFRHLGILEQGVEYARPEVQMASVFDDGRALCVHTDIERTCASIARFSERDAETFARFKTEARQYVDLMLETFMYGPPVGINDLTKALVTFGLEGRSEFLEAKLRGSTIEQFLERHFESDQVKAHLAFHGALCGYATDQKGLAVGYPLLVGKIDNWQVCLGGSHRVAHALWRDLVAHGGLVFVQSEVTRILTDGAAPSASSWGTAARSRPASWSPRASTPSTPSVACWPPSRRRSRSAPGSARCATRPGACSRCTSRSARRRATRPRPSTRTSTGPG